MQCKKVDIYKPAARQLQNEKQSFQNSIKIISI